MVPRITLVRNGDGKMNWCKNINCKKNVDKTHCGEKDIQLDENGKCENVVPIQ